MTEARMSESIAAISEALATAQAGLDNVLHDRDVEVPIKDKANPGQYKGKYKYRYATLPGILNHIRDALTGQGIWYTQFVRGGTMVTRLFHKSGEWMDSGDLPMPDIKGSPQEIGAIISYFKRYSLTAAMGLAAEDDNEGDVHEDSEVSFRARGSIPDTDAGIEVPPQGWGDWARGLIDVVKEKGSNDELDTLKDANKRFINGCYKVDRAMYTDIQKAFENRRAVLDPNVGF